MQPSISRVEGALERVPHPDQCLALLTPGTGLFSPQCSNLWLGTMLEQASGLLFFFPGSEGSWALSQDSGHISDTPLPFPGLRTNLSGKMCAHQVPSKDPVPCSTANTVGQPVLRSESPSQGLIRGPAAVVHINFPSLALLC